MTLRNLIELSADLPVQYLDLPLSVDLGDDFIEIGSVDECHGTLAFSPVIGFSDRLIELEEIEQEYLSLVGDQESSSEEHW